MTMKIRGNVVGTPLKPAKVLVKATDLTQGEKAIFRKGVGALGAEVIAQTTGDSEDLVMSQWAVTKALGDLPAGGGGAAQKTTSYHIESPGWTRIAKLSEHSVMTRFDLSISSPIRLGTPFIALIGDILYIRADDNASINVIYANGEEVATADREFDLSTLNLPDGTYRITVRSRGEDRYDSYESESILYESAYVPGLYDADGSMVATWGVLTDSQREGGYGMNVEGDYDFNLPDWNNEGHPATILKINPMLATGTTLVIPGTVKYISAYAFEGCNLTEVVILGGATRIEQNAFAACDNLQKVVIRSGVRTIEQGAFRACYNLSDVVLPEGLKKIDTWAFSECPLEEVTLPSTVQTVGQFAFEGCKATEITIPAGLLTLGAGAFANSTNLENIYVEDGNPNYKNGVAEDENGKLINFVTDITGFKLLHYPDAGAKGLRVTLPITIKEIGPWGMAGSLCGELIIPDDLRSIGDYAFKGSGSLNLAFLPQTITYIGAYAFQDCASLVGSWNEDIGDWMLRVGGDLEKIAEGMFLGCEGLVNIYFEGDIPRIEGEAFLRCGKLASVSVSNALEWFADTVFEEIITTLFVFTFRGTQEEWDAIMANKSQTNMDRLTWLDRVFCIPYME